LTSFKPYKNIKNNNINDKNAINIFAAGQLNTTISTKQLEKECELSRRSIPKILHENKFHPRMRLKLMCFTLTLKKLFFKN